MLYLPDCPACMANADNGRVDNVFSNDWEHGDILDDGESTCDWYNDECPGECRMEHDEPEPNRYNGLWRCPSDNTTYRWCNPCGDWQEWTSRYDNYPVRLFGEWYCNPQEHDFYSCEDCGHYVYEDDIHWINRGWESAAFCYDCASEYRQNDEGSSGEAVQICGACGSPNTYLDELAEEFVCKCEADRLRQAKKPVVLIAA